MYIGDRGSQFTPSNQATLLGMNMLKESYHTQKICVQLLFPLFSAVWPYTFIQTSPDSLDEISPMVMMKNDAFPIFWH